MTDRITNKRPGKQPWMPLFTAGTVHKAKGAAGTTRTASGSGFRRIVLAQGKEN